MPNERMVNPAPAPGGWHRPKARASLLPPGERAPDPFADVSDPEQMCDLFERADFRFIPLDRTCHSIQQSVELDRTSVYAFSGPSRTVITGAIGPESVGLLLVTGNPDGAMFTGERLHAGDVIVAGPGAEYCSTGRGRASRALLVPIREFEARVTALLGRECPPLNGRKYVFSLDRTDARRLERVLRTPWELRPEWQADGFDSRLIIPYEEELLEHVCTIVARAWNPIPDLPTRRTDRYALFAQAAQLMRDPGAQPVRLSSICTSLAASEETLRQTFREFVGLPPIRYAKLCRMHECRESLKAADPRVDNVKSVAWRCGITHLGRFAAEYRQMFGEHPRTTLHAD
jgi:AraC-like DNA-binding protein